jgi:hypothetical protein
MKVTGIFLVLFLVFCGVSVAAVPTGITHEATIYDPDTHTTTFWYNIWPTTPAASHVVLVICGEIVDNFKEKFANARMDNCFKICLSALIFKDYFTKCFTIYVAVAQDAFAKSCDDFIKSFRTAFNCYPR